MFAYLYYRIHAIYKYKWNDSLPGIYAICITSLLQGFNVLSGIFAAELYSQIDFEIRKIHYGLLIVVLIALNYYRFILLTNFSELEKKWRNELVQIKKLRGILVLSYISASIILMLFLADYMSDIRF